MAMNIITTEENNASMILQFIPFLNIAKASTKGRELNKKSSNEKNLSQQTNSRYTNPLTETKQCKNLKKNPHKKRQHISSKSYQ